MKEKLEVIRRLIERTQDDFVSYYERTAREQDAKQIVAYALKLDHALVRFREPLDQMLPDTEDGGGLKASYALNTGCMILGLIDAMEGSISPAYEEATTLFLDTADFRAREALEGVSVERPSEEQIASHEIMLNERQWLSELVTAPQAGQV